MSSVSSVVLLRSLSVVMRMISQVFGTLCKVDVSGLWSAEASFRLGYPRREIYRSPWQLRVTLTNHGTGCPGSGAGSRHASARYEYRSLSLILVTAESCP